MKKFSLVMLDIVLLYVALIITLFIRYPSQFSFYYQVHLLPFLIIFALWILIFYIANLYDVRLMRNTIHFFSSLIRAIIGASVISVTFFYLIPIFGITPKTNLFIFILIFSGLDMAGRYFFNTVTETRFKKPTIIVDISDQAYELAKALSDNPSLGYDLRALVDLGGNGPAQNEFPVMRGISDFEDIVTREKINTVIVGPEAYRLPAIIDLLYKLLDRKINFYNLASFYERATGQVPLGAINQIWFLENLSEGTKHIYEISKRALDIVNAVILGLTSLLFYPFIIMAIKLDSRGPVFYRQTRVGQKGRKFEMIKFRTMIKDAEKNTGAVWAKDNDHRTTRVGRFLRKTRLDELPQIWNILKGDMSLVGPRAERPEFYNTLKNEVPFYEERYLIKPGLSGWAQINFRYGSSVRDAAEKLKYDLYYIKNRSLLLDLGIILQTIRIALQQSGK